MTMSLRGRASSWSMRAGSRSACAGREKAPGKNTEEIGLNTPEQQAINSMLFMEYINLIKLKGNLLFESANASWNELVNAGLLTIRVAWGCASYSLIAIVFILDSTNSLVLKRNWQYVRLFPGVRQIINLFMCLQPLFDSTDVDQSFLPCEISFARMWSVVVTRCIGGIFILTIGQ